MPMSPGKVLLVLEPSYFFEAWTLVLIIPLPLLIYKVSYTHICYGSENASEVVKCTYSHSVDEIWGQFQ